MNVSLLLAFLPPDFAAQLAVHLHTAADAVATKDASKLEGAGRAITVQISRYVDEQNIDLDKLASTLQAILGIDIDLSDYISVMRDEKKGAPN